MEQHSKNSTPCSDSDLNKPKYKKAFLANWENFNLYQISDKDLLLILLAVILHCNYIKNMPFLNCIVMEGNDMPGLCCIRL